MSPVLTPHKRRRLDTMPKNEKGDIGSQKKSVEVMDDTLDETPRPSRRQEFGQLDDPPLSLSSDQSRRISARSTSPVKKMADMRLLSTPIVFKQFNAPNEEMPLELEEKRRKVVRISRGVGVI